ncbi:MAG: hypothetical protein Q9176_004451 [Flavoplaca citrina]
MIPHRYMTCGNLPDQMHNFVSLVGAVFGRVIADEAKSLKNPPSKIHNHVHLAHAPFINLLTATPMRNKPLDLFGFLLYFWRPAYVRLQRTGDEPDSNTAHEQDEPRIADYEDAKTALVKPQSI